MSTLSIGKPSRFVAAMSLLFTACHLDVVTSHYPDIAEARADRLFARGWLPDILPASTTDIRTSNDLDLNVSTGRFRMTPADLAGFAAFASEGAPAQSRLVDWDAVVAAYVADGFLPRTFRQGIATWVFFCRVDSGECQYVSWAG